MGIDGEPTTTWLKEGDIDKVLGKTVKVLILQEAKFVVYLDQDLEIEWHLNSLDLNDDEFGEVLNRVAYLESASRFITDVNTRIAIKRQIAEGLARYLGSTSLKIATEIFNLVQEQLADLNKRTSWGWYFNAAYGLTVACIVLWGTLWLTRDFFSVYIGRTGLDIIFGGLSGALGAIISVISRGNQINIDANAGSAIHMTEGTARIIVGIAGASFVALAYKGGLFFTGVKFAGNEFAALLFLSMAAGASERLVPSLVAKAENLTSEKKN